MGCLLEAGYDWDMLGSVRIKGAYCIGAAIPSTRNFINKMKMRFRLTLDGVNTVKPLHPRPIWKFNNLILQPRMN
jgi:hypothetical protein